MYHLPPTAAQSTDSVIYEILLHIIEQYNGERYFHLTMDCGPLNRNAAIYIGLLLCLIFLNFFDIGIIMFLQRHHSKEICDRFFGSIERAFEDNGVFGIESLLPLGLCGNTP